MSASVQPPARPPARADGTSIDAPVRVGSLTLRNRLYRAPVLEGAGDGPDAVEVYAKAFVANARHGVGMIVQGSSCVTEEGRTSPGMTLVDTREKVMRFAPMTEAVHREGAAVLLQLGHGGLYAMEAWHEPYASGRRGPLLAPSRPPWWVRPAFIGVPIHPMTVDEIHDLARRFGDSAAWAREAGYDGVQLGSANAKLLDQFLSPFYNRRRDEFGGGLENRARIVRLIREAVAERAGDDFPCTVKIPVEKAPPLAPHATLAEALELARLCEEWGFDALTPVEVSVFPDTTLSRGGVPTSVWRNPAMKQRLARAAPARRRRALIVAGYVAGGVTSRFAPVWNRNVFRAVKARVSVPVCAVGGIRTRAEADDILGSGDADLVGIGRPFYAEPEVAARILGARPSELACRNSNLCVPAQMLGMKGLCYNPEVKRSSAGSGS